jgi:hypothetical protein
MLFLLLVMTIRTSEILLLVLLLLLCFTSKVRTNRLFYVQFSTGMCDSEKAVEVQLREFLKIWGRFLVLCISRGRGTAIRTKVSPLHPLVYKVNPYINTRTCVHGTCYCRCKYYNFLRVHLAFRSHLPVVRGTVRQNASRAKSCCEKYPGKLL